MHAAVASLKRRNPVTDAELANNKTAINDGDDDATVHRLGVTINHQYVGIEVRLR